MRGLGLLRRMAQSAGGALDSTASKLKRNAEWHGAASNAVLGAGFGGGVAAVSGGSPEDVLRGAAFGGLGGAGAATLGLPGASIGGPIAGLISGFAHGDTPKGMHVLYRARQNGRGDPQSLMSYAMEVEKNPERAQQIAMRAHDIIRRQAGGGE